MELLQKIAALRESGMEVGDIALTLHLSLGFVEKVLGADSFGSLRQGAQGGAQEGKEGASE